MSSKSENNEETSSSWILKATVEAEAFEKYSRSRYAPTEAERLIDLHNVCEEVLKKLDSVPLDLRKTEYECSMYVYLRGRLLVAVPGYSKQAEDLLLQATELNPTLADAWRCLGVCASNKGEYNQAKLYFDKALTMVRDKKTLCQLALLEMEHASDSENPAEHIDESIRLANDAVWLEDVEGYTSYILGSAHFAAFYQTGEWNFAELQSSLNSYEIAMLDEEMETYPDLIYNCALVHSFLENYESALKGFENCRWADPPLEATHNRSMIIRLLNKLDESIKGKSKGKSKRKSGGTSLPTQISKLADVSLISSYERVNLDLISEGFNKSIAVIGKVLYSVKNERMFPLYYVFCDSEENRFVVTVHGIRNEAIKQGDQVTITDPYCKFVDFEWEGKRYQFKTVRANILQKVRVNGKELSPKHAVREPRRQYFRTR